MLAVCNHLLGLSHAIKWLPEQFVPQPYQGLRHSWLVCHSLMRFTWAHFSRSLWMAFHPLGTSTSPLSLVSSADLLRVHSTPLSHCWKYQTVLVPVFTLCLTHIPQDCKLRQCMIIAAQAASNLDVTDELSLALVTIRFSITPPVVGLSITWLKKLSSIHSRSLLDCLQLTVLLFQ